MFLVETAAGAVASAVLEQLIKERNRLTRFFVDSWERITQGKLSVVVFGLGGVGKTTTVSLLSGEFTLDTLPLDYKVTKKVEAKTLKGKTFVEIYEGGGQSLYRQTTWDDLYARLNQDARILLVNVLSYGYNALFETEYSALKEYEKDAAVSEVAKRYFANQRNEELSVTRSELMPHVKSAPGALHTISLITKQDLWWMERASVQRHYQGEGSKYDMTIKEIAGHRGRRNFKHACVSVCFNMLNLKTADNTILAATAAGYDRVLLNANYNNTLAMIRDLMPSA